MRTVTYSCNDWLNAFAALLGVEPPTEEDVNDLLALAGVAAHASERTAAPISCWLLARSGLSPATGRERAAQLAASLEE